MQHLGDSAADRRRADIPDGVAGQCTSEVVGGAVQALVTFFADDPSELCNWPPGYRHGHYEAQR
jgi:hypothetical protein